MGILREVEMANRWEIHMSDKFVVDAVKLVRGKAMLAAGGTGAAVGVNMGNSIIAAGLGAACSPFAAVPVLAIGGAFLAHKMFEGIIDALDD